MNGDLLYNIIAALVGAGAVYGGIRQDLKNMHEAIKENSRAVLRAHERIDKHLENKL
jgi:hypothetical protein